MSYACMYFTRIPADPSVEGIQLWVPAHSENGPNVYSMEGNAQWLQERRGHIAPGLWRGYLGRIRTKDSGYERPMITLATRRPRAGNNDTFVEWIGKQVCKGTWEEVFEEMLPYVRML